jgi:hypothetical protein
MAMTNPQIEERPEQPYLGIRCEITNGIRAAAGRQGIGADRVVDLLMGNHGDAHLDQSRFAALVDLVITDERRP